MCFILFSTAACAAAHPSVDAGSVSLNQPESSGKTLISYELTGAPVVVGIVITCYIYFWNWLG